MTGGADRGGHGGVIHCPGLEAPWHDLTGMAGRTLCRGREVVDAANRHHGGARVSASCGVTVTASRADLGVIHGPQLKSSQRKTVAGIALCSSIHGDMASDHAGGRNTVVTACARTGLHPGLDMVEAGWGQSKAAGNLRTVMAHRAILRSRNVVR